VDVGDHEEPQRTHRFKTIEGVFNVSGKGILNWSDALRRDRGEMGLNFSMRDTPFRDKMLHGALTELGNAVIALFWEGDMPRLGTLTVTLPDRSSSPLLGERDRQLGLILGMHISSHTGKMALVSTNMPLALGDAAGRVLLELARNLMIDSGLKSEGSK